MTLLTGSLPQVGIEYPKPTVRGGRGAHKYQKGYHEKRP